MCEEYAEFDSKSRRCRLCLRDNQQVRRSHVVPEFLYKYTYEEPSDKSSAEWHRAVAIDPRPDCRNLVVQKGIRERLLCHCCEGYLCNNFET